MKFVLNCDCSYRARVQMLFFRLTERGQYRAVNGQISFERKSGQTVWQYRLSGDRLYLTEYPGEVYAYRRRSAPGKCGAPPADAETSEPHT
jgi:hypothetical protein